MEDLKPILYILAIIAYFIYTAWRKAFKTPDEGAPPQEMEPRERPASRPLPPPAPHQRQQRPVAPATSFEDILREMQTKMDRANEQGRQPVEKPQPAYQAAPQPTPQPAHYEAMTALSMEDPVQARMIEKREKARKLALSEPFVVRKPQKPQASIYAQMLHNPQSVRQAFILTEIFNRKQY